MSLLLKRRSRSETRSTQPAEIPTSPPMAAAPMTRAERPRRGRTREPPAKQQLNMDTELAQFGSEQHLHQLSRSSDLGLGFGHSLGLGRRKTSAELISEAKLFLGEVGSVSAAMASVGGARLVSTRRPITPREPGRVLYGKVALAGRPPSAFSMRYLQNESHKPLTPSSTAGGGGLQPIKAGIEVGNGNANGNPQERFIGRLAPRQLPALHGSLEPPPTRRGALLTQSSIETLIQLLKQQTGLKDCSEETVQHINAILQELYTRVRQQERGCKRGFILGGLYGLVECTAPRVLLAVARVVLALRVTGSNLTGACKLIFKVARHEQHDSLFYENDLLELLIDGLGHASPLDEPEACIYAYGSIRFLTASSAQERDDALNRNWAAGLDEPAAVPLPRTNPLLDLAAARHSKLSRQCTLVERLARHGAVDLMILHLQMLNEAGATRRLSGPPLHTLYQLSAALRALADVAQQQQRAVASGEQAALRLELACPHLIRAAEISMGELEVQANVVRTLSVLSEDSACCETLLNYAARIGMLLGPCADAASQPASEKLLAVLSRLGYILGNILAKYESARVQYYHNDVAMEYLLNALQALSSDSSSSSDALLDVQIKLIRVVANMSVNAEVGFGLGNTRSLGAILLQLLSGNSKAMMDKKQQQSKQHLEQRQELLHATLGALHNLCFYQDKQTPAPAQVREAPGSLQSVMAELATVLCEALGSCPPEATTTKAELARVLGNLTRNEQARRCFCATGGLPLIVQQLTRHPAAQDYELKTCAIGVLVNLLGDAEQRSPFLQLRGVEVLALLLRGALEQEDWFLSTIVCQALWNLLIDAQCAGALCRSSTLDEVSDLLADYLDEERGGAGGAGGELELDTKDNEEEEESPDVVWEDFAVVATDLLERIHNNYDKQPEEQLEEEQRPPDNHTNIDNDDEDVYIEEM